MEARRVITEYERSKGNTPLDRLLSVGGLESAVAQPYSGYHRFIHEKGATLVDSVVRNHPFVDGNKRVAAALLVLLVSKSGYRFTDTSESSQIELGKMIENLAAHSISREAFGVWLRARVAAI